MIYTQVKMPDFPFSIDYEQQIMLIGSCFSDHIYQKLKQRQFKVHANPFGITYNPISIAKGMDQILTKKTIAEADLVFNHEIYHSFDFHGQFSHPSKEVALAGMNNSILAAAKIIQETSILVITLGTANAFRLKTNQNIVNNCHKFPGDLFEKKLLPVAEIVASFDEIIKQLPPTIKIILTVSPIRHIRDGLITNQQSKARLLLAARALEMKHENIYYFPSYEIMLDELRDYRYYKEDMIHPTDWAVNYIWGRFKQTFFDETTSTIEKAIEKIWVASQHRPVFPDSEEHQKFIRQQIKKIDELGQKYPYLATGQMLEWFGQMRD